MMTCENTQHTKKKVKTKSKAKKKHKLYVHYEEPSKWKLCSHCNGLTIFNVQTSQQKPQVTFPTYNVSWRNLYIKQINDWLCSENIQNIQLLLQHNK